MKALFQTFEQESVKLFSDLYPLMQQRNYLGGQAFNPGNLLELVQNRISHTSMDTNQPDSPVNYAIQTVTLYNLFTHFMTQITGSKQILQNAGKENNEDITKLLEKSREVLDSVPDNCFKTFLEEHKGFTDEYKGITRQQIEIMASQISDGIIRDIHKEHGIGFAVKKSISLTNARVIHSTSTPQPPPAPFQ